MTSPDAQPTPRTERVTLTITASPDLLGIVKAREIEQTLRRLVDRTWGSGVTVEREAADAAALDREAAWALLIALDNPDLSVIEEAKENLRTRLGSEGTPDR